MVGAVAAAGDGEPLAGRSAHKDVHIPALQQFIQFTGVEAGEVLLQDVGHVGKVPAKDGHGMGINVHRRQGLKTGSFHSQTEAATATEQVHASRRFRRCSRAQPRQLRRCAVASP